MVMMSLSRTRLSALLFLPALSSAVNVDFKLEDVPLPKAVGMIYGEVLNKPYMLDLSKR